VSMWQVLRWRRKTSRNVSLLFWDPAAVTSCFLIELGVIPAPALPRFISSHFIWNASHFYSSRSQMAALPFDVLHRVVLCDS
jgi:hypothetical protein